MSKPTGLALKSVFYMLLPMEQSPMQAIISSYLFLDYSEARHVTSALQLQKSELCQTPLPPLQKGTGLRD